VSPEGNTRIQLSDEALKQAQSRSAEARAAPAGRSRSLPHGPGTRRPNPAAMGSRSWVPIPGFQFPTFVGPFTTMDARATVTQSVFDFSSIKRFQASEGRGFVGRSDVDSTKSRWPRRWPRAYLAAVPRGCRCRDRAVGRDAGGGGVEAGGEPKNRRHGDPASRSTRRRKCSLPRPAAGCWWPAIQRTSRAAAIDARHGAPPRYRAGIDR